MAKIVGKIVAMQNHREGVNTRGEKWQSCEYVIQDVSHEREGVIVRAFRESHINEIGNRTNGQIMVEVEYITYLRYWDGTKNGVAVGAGRWMQENFINNLKVLSGNTPANAPANIQGESSTKEGDLPF